MHLVPWLIICLPWYAVSCSSSKHRSYLFRLITCNLNSTFTKWVVWEHLAFRVTWCHTFLTLDAESTLHFMSLSQQFVSLQFYGKIHCIPQHFTKFQLLILNDCPMKFIMYHLKFETAVWFLPQSSELQSDSYHGARNCSLIPTTEIGTAASFLPRR